MWFCSPSDHQVVPNTRSYQNQLPVLRFSTLRTLLTAEPSPGVRCLFCFLHYPWSSAAEAHIQNHVNRCWLTRKVKTELIWLSADCEISFFNGVVFSIMWLLENSWHWLVISWQNASWELVNFSPEMFTSTDSCTFDFILKNQIFSDTTEREEAASPWEERSGWRCEPAWWGRWRLHEASRQQRLCPPASPPADHTNTSRHHDLIVTSSWPRHQTHWQQDGPSSITGRPDKHSCCSMSSIWNRNDLTGQLVVPECRWWCWGRSSCSPAVCELWSGLQSEGSGGAGIRPQGTWDTQVKDKQSDEKLNV